MNYHRKLIKSILIIGFPALLILLTTTQTSAGGLLHNAKNNLDLKNAHSNTLFKNRVGQFRNITGRVTDDKGSPLIGVTVKVDRIVLIRIRGGLSVAFGDRGLRFLLMPITILPNLFRG